MAFITVGINTDRVYNKKNPPGGRCADLFGGSEEIITNPKNLNRQGSSVDLGGGGQEQNRAQKKSQPSVCPLTGETLGHGVARLDLTEKTPEAGTEAMVKRESAAATTAAATTAEMTSAATTADMPAAATTAEMTAAATLADRPAAPAPDAAAVSEAAPAAPQDAETAPQTEAVVKTTEGEPAHTKAIEQTVSAPLSAPAPAPAPAPTPVAAPSPAPASPTPAPVVSSAPVQQRRRNPPGGVSTGFW